MLALPYTLPNTLVSLEDVLRVISSKTIPLQRSPHKQEFITSKNLSWLEERTANYVSLCHLYTVHVNRCSIIVIDIHTYMPSAYVSHFIITIPFSFCIMPSSLLCSSVPYYFHFNHSCIIAAARSLFSGENIQFKIVFFFFFFIRKESHQELDFILGTK